MFIVTFKSQFNGHFCTIKRLAIKFITSSENNIYLFIHCYDTNIMREWIEEKNIFSENYTLDGK